MGRLLTSLRETEPKRLYGRDWATLNNCELGVTGFSSQGSVTVNGSEVLTKADLTKAMKEFEDASRDSTLQTARDIFMEIARIFANL